MLNRMSSPINVYKIVHDASQQSPAIIAITSETETTSQKKKKKRNDMELNVKEAIESTSHINILLFLSLALSSSLEYNDEIDSTTDSNQ